MTPGHRHSHTLLQLPSVKETAAQHGSTAAHGRAAGELQSLDLTCAPPSQPCAVTLVSELNGSAKLWVPSSSGIFVACPQVGGTERCSLGQRRTLSGVASALEALVGV